MVAAGHQLAVGSHFEPAAELAVAVDAALGLGSWSAVRSGRYYDGSIVQRRLATVPDPVAAKIAAHMEPPQVLPQTQSQHLPATDAEKRHWLEPAAEAIHSNTVRSKQRQGCHIHAWLMKPDFWM